MQEQRIQRTFLQRLLQPKPLCLLITGMCISGMLLLLLNEFHEEITEPWLSNLDLAAMKRIHSWTAPELTRVMFAFTGIGSLQFLLPTVSSIVVILILVRRKADASILAIAVGGSAGLNVLLKIWFHRARPEVAWALTHEHSFSFPSGHAVAAFCFCAAIVFLLARRRHVVTRIILIVAALFMIVGIGMSRVYLGVHYPSDIAAGYLVGMVWTGSVLISSVYLATEAKPRSKF
jgi:undecaprenyl-diphosphatase